MSQNIARTQSLEKNKKISRKVKIFTIEDIVFMFHAVSNSMCSTYHHISTG
jgi:hypothetical protein